MLKLIISFFLLISSLTANAALTPTVTAWRFSNTDTHLIWHDKDAACEHWRAKRGYYATRLNENGFSCMAIYLNSDGSTRENYGDYLVSVPNQCPANSSISGNACVCNSGYEEKTETNTCALPAPVDHCEGLADYCANNKQKEREWNIGGSTRPASICYKPQSMLVGAGGGLSDRFPGCNKGCNLGTSAGVVKYEDGQGKSKITGYGLFSGDECNAEPEPQTQDDPLNPESPNAKDPDPQCKNGFKGTVNGVVVCVPPKKSEAVKEMETKDNGDGTKTESTTTVKCEGGKCEITKSSTTTNSTTNSTVSSSSVTTTVDKKDYCANNKTSDQCKGENGEEEGDGSFGGSCQTGFECDGDALMCSVAKEQHKRACEFFVNETPESQLYGNSVTKQGKVTDDLEGNETISMEGRINQTSALGAGSCPLRDITVSVMGHTRTLPLSEHCATITAIKNFLVGVAMLIALFIVFRK